jgi:hypothetical protein
MLTQVVRTSKNFLAYGNLLDRGVVGTASLQGRRMNVLLLLTPRRRPERTAHGARS